MMTRDGGCNREQIGFTSLEDLVPEDPLVRKLENAIDWSFIYEMVEGRYCEDNGRPSLDPVILIKLAVVQHMTLAIAKKMKDQGIDLLQRKFCSRAFYMLSP